MPNTNPSIRTREVVEVHVLLEDEVIDAIRGKEQVEIHLHSRANNREPAPMRLSYTQIRHLTLDYQG